MKLSIPILLAMLFAWPFFFVASCLALQPDELLVVSNRHAWNSIDLARHYMKKRGVPEKNLIKISVKDKENCRRDDYEKRIAEPVREKLKEYPLAKRPRCIVLVKGVPLRIGAVPLTQAEQSDIDGLKDERKQLKDHLKTVKDEAEKKQITDALAAVERKIKVFNMSHNTGASVDSELMLVLVKDYPLPMWVANPFFLGYKDQKLTLSKNDVLMVSRLDAPTPKIVRQIIDDAIITEKNGLTGTAYFDARYKAPGDKKVTGYGLYDKSIYLAADRIRKKKVMPVVLEDTQKLFQSGSCPQAALYCGWYSLGRYVDAFEWVPGAIGYHIASMECQTLRKGGSQVWCKRMLEEGVAVTIGPVGEPYVQAFPLPEIFFGVLTEGSLTVAEAYLLSVPYLSWKMVLVGDPLYRPFKEQ
jgi:uncharacterized protein (TIGR03790 family)